MKKINKKFKNVLALTLATSITPVIVSCGTTDAPERGASDNTQLKADINAYILRLNTQTSFQYKRNLETASTTEDLTRLKNQITEYWNKLVTETQSAIDKVTDTQIKTQLTTEFNGFKNSNTSTESNFNSLKQRAKDQENKEKNPNSNTNPGGSNTNNNSDPNNGQGHTANPGQPGEPTQNPQELEPLKQEIRALIQQLPDDNRQKGVFGLRIEFSQTKQQLEALKTEVQNAIKEEQEAAQDTSPTETRTFSFQKISQEKAIEKLKDRSFSIGYGYKNKGEQVYSNYDGTGWLLDYAFDNNQSKQNLILFLATNLHVHNRQANTFEGTADKGKFLEYETTEDSKNTNFFLGVPKSNINTAPIKNKQIPSIETNIPKLYSNLPDSVTDKQKSTPIGDILGNPKTVFAAIDIFDSTSNNQLKQTASVRPNDEFTDQKLGIDFAVFAVEIKYSSLNNSEHKELKDHIDKAIKSFDDDLKSLKHDGDTLYIPFDYASSYQKNNRRALKPERIYIGGYPKASDLGSVFMTNTSTDLNHDITYRNNTFTNNLTVSPVFDSKRATVPFGYSFNVDNSSLYYGASGSMVLNEYGVPVGIYSTVDNTDGASDLSKRGGFIQLIMTQDNPATNFAYNLIDGSDKSKYPKQEKSYRQNLAKLTTLTSKYPKTALFPEGIIKNS